MGSNNDNGEMAVTVDQQNTEIALVNTSEPPASTVRARFIGQGYKQVRSILLLDIPTISSIRIYSLFSWFLHPLFLVSLSLSVGKSSHDIDVSG